MIKTAELDYRILTRSIDDIIKRIDEYNIVVLNEKYEDIVKNLVITSLIARIPIDKIYLKNKDGKLTVIDSLVLNIIYDFVNGKTKYESMIDGINDCYFSELSVSIQRRIKETNIDLICFDYKTESVDIFTNMINEGHKNCLI